MLCATAFAIVGSEDLRAALDGADARLDRELGQVGVFEQVDAAHGVPMRAAHISVVRPAEQCRASGMRAPAPQWSREEARIEVEGGARHQLPPTLKRPCSHASAQTQRNQQTTPVMANPPMVPRIMSM